MNWRAEVIRESALRPDQDEQQRQRCKEDAGRHDELGSAPPERDRAHHHQRHEEDDQRLTATRKPAQRAAEHGDGPPRGHERVVAAHACREPRGEAEVDEKERDRQGGNGRDRQQRTKTALLPPEHDGRDALGPSEHDAERVSRHHDQCRDRGQDGSPPGARRAGSNEEIERDRRGEGEQRIHAVDASVDADELRGGHDARTHHAGYRPCESPAEVVANGNGGHSEHDREPATRCGRRVGRQREMGQHEVQRRAASIDDGRRQELA
jgi:hypothetical protein